MEDDKHQFADYTAKLYSQVTVFLHLKIDRMKSAFVRLKFADPLKYQYTNRKLDSLLSLRFAMHWSFEPSLPQATLDLASLENNHHFSIRSLLLRWNLQI